MHSILKRGMTGYAGRGIALVLAFGLRIQAVFTSLIVTQHALAAGTPDFAFALCTTHEDANGVPQKAPAKPLLHIVHCTVCLFASSSLAVLPDTAMALLHFDGFEIARFFALFAADLPSLLSPKRSQGPPYNA